MVIHLLLITVCSKRVIDNNLLLYGILMITLCLLQAKYGSIHAKTELKDSFLLDLSLLKDCLSLEESQSLQVRVDHLTQEWPSLGLKLAERISQMKFEWSQTVSITQITHTSITQITHTILLLLYYLN